MVSDSSLPQRLCGFLLTALCASILGCSANVPSTSTLTGGQMRGNVHGGQQPVSGATIQLYAAGTTGYGSSATPLLASALVTDATGSFTIPSGYTCPSATSQLYIVATGGNPGLAPGTNNAALALMAALGPCSLHGGQLTLDPSSFITINEVTTVASVYALSAFMDGNATHVGTSGTNTVGLANSFALVNNLVNTTIGAALSVTPAGNGTVPQATINTLANIVASCVNSDGTGTACTALAVAATPSGGAPPTNTIQGTYNVARNPANNVSALFALESATPPFQPTLSTAPNDWVLGVTYTTGGSPVPGIAIDASGDVWFPSSVFGGPFSVVELSNSGTVLSGANGYSVGGLTNPAAIAIDPAGNAWVAGTGEVAKLSNSGLLLSGANGFTGGGLSTPVGIAVDGQGNAWVADFGSNSTIKLDNNGNILSGSSGFQTGRSGSPTGIGIDRTGNAWVGNSDPTVTEYSNGGTLLSGSSGFSVSGVQTFTVAFDPGGNVWLNSQLNNTIPFGKLNSSGVQLSPAAGYTNCVSQALPGNLLKNCLWWNPDAFAVDGAGNVWNEFVWETVVNGRDPNPMISGAVAEMSNTGATLSGINGFTGGTALGVLSPLVGPGNGATARSIAIDGGGDVWLLLTAGTVAEFVGAATPVVTPFSLGVKNGTLGQRP